MPNGAIFFLHQTTHTVVVALTPLSGPEPAPSPTTINKQNDNPLRRRIPPFVVPKPKTHTERKAKKQHRAGPVHPLPSKRFPFKRSYNNSKFYGLNLRPNFIIHPIVLPVGSYQQWLDNQ